MNQAPNNEQCEALAKKHNIPPGDRLFNLIRETYRLGRDADVMKTKHNDKEKMK